MTQRPSPRRTNGAKPQELLTSLLGDFWYWREEHIPSAALVELLGDFDVTPAGARTAMRRLAGRGLLTVQRNGRTTAYGIPPRTVAVIVEHTHRMLAFGSAAPEWDGMWTVVAFSVPEEDRGLRSELRSRLRVLRFAALYDGVWVSPHERTGAALAVLEELGVSTATVLRSKEARKEGSQSGGLQEAFDVKQLSKEYQRFVDHYGPLLERVNAGQVGPAEALRTRTEVGAQWRRFQETDPDLPLELLPSDWPRESARHIFVQIHDRLGPVAELRFRQVLGRTSPGLAELAARHDRDSVAALYDSLGDYAQGDTPFERATEARRLSKLGRGGHRRSDGRAG